MYEFHKHAALFPMLAGEDLKKLADDIKAKGLTEPITLHEGKILDGRNRYNASKLAKVELGPDQFDTYEGDDPLGFVISKNLHRRHLTDSQRIMIAAEVATMTHGGNRKKDQTANLQVEITQAQAAKKFDVSERSVAAAKTITDQDLKDDVKSGKKKVHAAAKEQKARGSTKKGPRIKSLEDIRKVRRPASVLDNKVAALGRDVRLDRGPERQCRRTERRFEPAPPLSPQTRMRSLGRLP